MQKALRWLAIGWMLGIATFWGGAVATDSMYEYRMPVQEDNVRAMINEEGWVPIDATLARYTFRRSRFRIP